MIPSPFTREQSPPDGLVEGHYLITRWRAGRVPIPFRAWYGPPLDPDTGEEMDRAPRWQIMLGGVPILDDQAIDVGGLFVESLSDIWPACLSNRISSGEHDYLVARAGWAAEHDCADPFGTSSGRIDPMTATLPIMENV